ncbi:non-homologous end-joining DNA ligase [Chryseosolibacter indicus]|uniref:DNA ligase (ATP) n=1 Tax=Chryseosolibacter indicus TaxID=2782351 RepID=A0ABS5VQK7_9BACT|nr:non-homologous end-joining DNA ligase [Chryseosolibacter indicus]MBT1703725.1 non-homologous end-joining DNA ligase [Chryseosolibacter indicus]
MAKKNSQWVQVGKRNVELSNLDKVLFPEDHVLKAEVIEYYLKIAPTILNHIKGRALSFIRFPDGIHGESFYQKNKPDFAPNWVEFETLGKEEKDYIVATEPALLVWLANLASLEFHQLHSRKPAFDKPDYMVFDLDPPEGYDFKKLKPIAFDLKEHIEQFGYTPFVKTTGGKGLHICCPLEPQQGFSEVFDAAQAIAQPFVESLGEQTTLHIKKEARKGRVLVDIYRIRSGQTIVSPYSLRGRVGAPVSMPLTWEELEDLDNPKVFNIQNAVDKVLKDGDAWESIGAYAVELHTHRKEKTSKAKKLGPSKKHKTPEQLETYSKKRDFEKTPEPVANIITGSNNNFVVHRHHASHLHYDLRLEKDGVLKSWAVPRGLPPRPGVKRLAVQTEDHPMEYLTFNGSIPKGQYGGGEMWIYALGKYQVTKEKKDGFYFRLNSKEMTGEYRMHKTKEKEYLLERVDEPQLDYINKFIEPMLTESSDEPPKGDDFIYEIKWDGIRALIAYEEGKLTIHTRNQNDVTKQFPELLDGEKAFRATNAVFDAEIVHLDATGKPVFKKVINRLMTSGDAAIQKISKTTPCYCYIFDCLYLDGRSLLNEPLMKRKDWLRDAVRGDTAYRVSEFVDDGEALLNAAREHGLEGIIAKRKDSKYLPGKRTDCWYKIKLRQSAEVVIIGYTKGKGDRSVTFGALHIAERVGDELHYRGKVGTGFDDSTMKDIFTTIKKVNTTKRPDVIGTLLDPKVSVWLEPKIIAEVSYAKLTPDKMFREPVFMKLRPDISEVG